MTVVDALSSMRRHEGVGWFHEIRSHRLALVGLIILIVVIFAAIFASFLAPYDPQSGIARDRLSAPSPQHWLGTDEFGRDVLSRLMFGARNSLIVALAAVVLGTLAGAVVGLSSGYRGGRFDLLVQRGVDIVMALPLIVLALLLMAALGPSLASVVIAIGFGIAPRTSRVARAGAMTIRETTYVEAAVSVGAPQARIVWQHVLPNVLAILITYATAQLGHAIVLESSLSFLGAGLPPESPSWGRMLTTAARYVGAAPWLALAPGIALTLTVFSVNIVGDAIRDIADPTLRRAQQSESDHQGSR